jgi:hypothetical protein
MRVTNRKLGPEAARHIFSSCRPLKVIAHYYGVSMATCSRIRTGKLYKWATS